MFAYSFREPPECFGECLTTESHSQPSISGSRELKDRRGHGVIVIELL